VGRATYGLYIEEQGEVFAEESELSSQFILFSNMKKEHAVDFINRGKMPGAQLDAGPDYIGWINVKKLFVNQRLFDLHADDYDSPIYKAEKLTWEKPYRTHVQELRRDVYESDVYSANEDYRRNDVYRFYNLYEVEEFLQGFGKEFTDLKWPQDYTHF
jgi:hypothetical protein